MPIRKKLLDPWRKRPGQARSKATVDAIFEATARIVQQHGGPGLNTNLIAEQAGVSVGTLYQYFPNKEAILIEMARRELAITPEAVLASLRPEPGGAPVDPVRAIVRVLLHAAGGRQRLRKVLIETVVASGLSGELARPVETVARAIAANLRAGAAGDLSPERLFVLTRAVLGAVRAAVMEESPLLSSPGFEDELVRLVRAYLAS
jgi:AcrR family transcriptional regulator